MIITISEAEKAAIEAAAKANRNKRVAKRLEVLELRYAGKSNSEISMRTGFNERYRKTVLYMMQELMVVSCSYSVQQKPRFCYLM